ncbi:MAG: LicD family protein [Muribaculaceae bacterium]|nr:LicD family protein [Muribaculaceae bacterium]
MITKDIDELCSKHKINYFLAGGSMLGAVRHQGFIPWDDDLDIIMPPEDYKRFIEICKSKEFNSEKYSLQESYVDWPKSYSKIRLNNTVIKEPGEYEYGHKGIFIDIFSFDYASNNKAVRLKQYIAAKLLVAYQLSLSSYSDSSISKRVAMSVAKLLKWKPLRNFVISQSQSKKESKYYSIAKEKTRWHSAFIPKELFNESVRVKFEDYTFPIPKKAHDYLSIIFGDYMKLPPAEEQHGSHATYIDFGPY